MEGSRLGIAGGRRERVRVAREDWQVEGPSHWQQRLRRCVADVRVAGGQGLRADHVISRSRDVNRKQPRHQRLDG
jgi:hypothetical protein